MQIEELRSADAALIGKVEIMNRWKCTELNGVEMFSGKMRNPWLNPVVQKAHWNWLLPGDVEK